MITLGGVNGVQYSGVYSYDVKGTSTSDQQEVILVSTLHI